MICRLTSLAVIVGLMSGCNNNTTTLADNAQPEVAGIYGTQEPFAAEAVYFVVTDRFVDGDPTNNHEDQGGDYPTFNLRLDGPDGKYANVGYMGGDFQGVLNNADYIAEMGFTAVWLTPVLDNPDQAFTGDEPISYGGQFKDGGKAGYHGYWATNFYKADEHLISKGLAYRDYAKAMADKGFKNVLDIVANHGSPSFTMPEDQPGYGEIYDADGNLVADHMNLAPDELDMTNPLNQFFHPFRDLATLSNLNEDNPDVQDYLINSYLYWIEQGADAFRIDTIRHVKHSFWREMSDRVRAKYPDFFMFGESFVYDANFIAQHTLPKNGAISVLDFPMQKAMVEVFENSDSDFATLADTLYLTHGPYNNPYELTTFYDNHDMARMNASDNGFIDAHNWLFTVRGIPVVYQGSEFAFMRGTSEHMGNRNFIGQEQLDANSAHPIRQSLAAIANVRKGSPALQRGLQYIISLAGDEAIFLRVVDDGKDAQIALVMLNKGDVASTMNVDTYIQEGQWVEALTGDTIRVAEGGSIRSTVEAHGVNVWLLNEPVRNQSLRDVLLQQMRYQ